MATDTKVSTLIINQVPYAKKSEPTYTNNELWFIEDNLAPNKVVVTDENGDLSTADISSIWANVDGGSSISVYLSGQKIDGGSAI